MPFMEDKEIQDSHVEDVNIEILEGIKWKISKKRTRLYYELRQGNPHNTRC